VIRLAEYLPRRERLHFAFLHIVRRLSIQRGLDPTGVEEGLVSSERRPGILVEWWHRCAREFVASLPRRANLPAQYPWPPPLHMAEDEDLMAVVVGLAPYVDTRAPAYPWYCDGWQELVAWALAGCPQDEHDRNAAKARAANASADRFAALDAEGRLDAVPADPKLDPPKLGVVQDAGPLFDSELPPLSLDMEAEYDDEPTDAEWSDR
jgi:hypothetical protein